MAELLEVLRDWPEVNVDEVRGQLQWDQVRAWGWVMESGELTGSRWRHVHELPTGIVAGVEYVVVAIS